MRLFCKKLGSDWPFLKTKGGATSYWNDRLWGLKLEQDSPHLCASQIDWTADVRWVCLAWLHHVFSMLDLPEAFVLLKNLQYASACFIFYILPVIFMVCCLQLCFITGLKDVYYMACCYCTDDNLPLVSGRWISTPSSDTKISKCSGPRVK